MSFVNIFIKRCMPQTVVTCNQENHFSCPVTVSLMPYCPFEPITYLVEPRSVAQHPGTALP